MESRTIKCMIPAYNSCGGADIYFIKVKCTEEQFDFGLHLEAACSMADMNDHESCGIGFDEEDIVGKRMLDWFEWDTADIFDIIGDEDYNPSNVDVCSDTPDVFNN